MKNPNHFQVRVEEIWISSKTMFMRRKKYRFLKKIYPNKVGSAIGMKLFLINFDLFPKFWSNKWSNSDLKIVKKNLELGMMSLKKKNLIKDNFIIIDIPWCGKANSAIRIAISEIGKMWDTLESWFLKQNFKKITRKV